ncbi:TY-Chap domain-containing protein [Nocardia africana]|uniref:TY-Chap N-terminal domain-containing protein n=1 Tax=Nocardia africana TaxID=134964 RepID=A0A378WVU7_9NOCA|nr:hypothetical protein [Nocardia africana]MCC3313627.1 hypothetical protein [Nocardia africana]SUA44992.1 Uncharacterised protein [Nocardia africana]
MDTVNVFGAEWREFSSALALTLSGMQAPGFLVIDAPSGVYARFHMNNFRSWCEVVHNSQLDEKYRMPEQAEARLRRQGWSAPVEGKSVNWYRTVAWPAHYRGYELVADEVTAALHQGLNVRAPADLDIQSWIEDSEDVFLVDALLAATGHGDQATADL